MWRLIRSLTAEFSTIHQQILFQTIDPIASSFSSLVQYKSYDLSPTVLETTKLPEVTPRTHLGTLVLLEGSLVFDYNRTDNLATAFPFFLSAYFPVGLATRGLCVLSISDMATMGCCPMLSISGPSAIPTTTMIA